MITLAQIRKLKPKQFFAKSSSTLTSTTFTKAQTFPKWCEAMQEEISAVIHNDTWQLLPRNNQQNVTGCKWKYRIKQKMDRIINRYKAYLVTKGFHRCPRMEFSNTFSLIMKPTIIRIILCLLFPLVGMSNSWISIMSFT